MVMYIACGFQIADPWKELLLYGKELLARGDNDARHIVTRKPPRPRRGKGVQGDAERAGLRERTPGGEAREARPGCHSTLESSAAKATAAARARAASTSL